MADTPKKRPWFQFHLSTAVVLMFVAGGLMWANMRPRQCLYSLPEMGAGAVGLTYSYGWPQVVWVSGLEDDPSVELAYLKAAEIHDRWAELPYVSMNGNLSYLAGVVDAFAAAGVLVVTVFVCECLIRRRLRKNAAELPPHP